MLNVDKIISMSPQILDQLLPDAWLETAWNAAVEGIIHDKTKVIKVEQGIWIVQCTSMRAVAELQVSGNIIRRLHALHTRRELPPLRGFAAKPPIGMGTPMQMLKSIPIAEMPDIVWQKFAWKMSVDPDTAKATEIIGISQGIWQIRCDTQQAWTFLQNPEPTLGMLRWLSQYKALPEAFALDLRLGQLAIPSPQAPQPVTIVDDPDIPASITDPNMRRMLARLRPRSPKEKSNIR